MKPSELLEANRKSIRAIVAAHRGLNPRVFGSVAHGTDTEASDLDILVDCAKGMTLFDIGAIRVELLQLLGNISIDVSRYSQEIQSNEGLWKNFCKKIDEICKNCQ